MKVLSIDPGETHGWAYQDGGDDYPRDIIDLGQIEGLVALDDFLRAWDLEARPVEYLVYEGYRNFNMKANFGKENKTSMAIGVIEVWAMRNKIPMYKYFSDQIDTVAKVVGMNPRIGAHKHTHWAFAANYGRHFLVKKGLAKSALTLKKMKDEKSQ